MTFWKKFAGLMALSLLVLALGCGGGAEKAEEPAAEEAPAADFVKVDPAKAATVTGKVKLEGAPPKMRPINMSAEPDCKGLHTAPPPAEVVVTKDGMLQNVLLWVKSGLAGKFEAAGSAHLDQKGCIYRPHVLAVQVGQMLRISNSDPTTHNVHPLPKTNREWNKSQPPGGAEIEYKFPREELMIPVKCNIHPWMRSYVSVIGHPFFAVSSEDGGFEIKGLPAGTYTIEAIHERFGKQESSVTVGDSESKDIEFTYQAG
jgi:plastocyanin